MAHSQHAKTDDQIRELYDLAVGAGIPVALHRADAYMLDMHGWDGDAIKAELKGYRWHEYVDTRDLKRVLAFIASAKPTGTMTYRGVCPGNFRCVCSISKLNGETLRLIVGAVKVSSDAKLPAPPCTV